MHKTLSRQIRHYIGDTALVTSPWKELLASISGTYGDFDTDRALIERSLDISSLELKGLISLLQATLDATNDGILVIDIHDAVLHYNKRFAEVIGDEIADIANHTAGAVTAIIKKKLHDPASFSRVLTIMADIVDESIDTIVFRDGRTIEVYSKPQHVEGKVVGRVWSFRDITARVHAEEQLKTQIAALKQLNRTMVDREVKIIELKDKVHSLTHSEATNMAQKAPVHTALGALGRIISKLHSSNAVLLDSYSGTNEHLSDLEKAQMAAASLLEDLEAEKNAVEQKVIDRTKDLEYEKTKLLQVTQNMKGSGILLDADRTVAFVNDDVYALLNISKHIPYNEILKYLFNYFDATDICGYFERCMQGETFQLPELEVNAKIYEIFFHCLKNTGSHETTGYFILIFDITESKLLERSKSELVAVASHQLRTPLTAMRGNVEMLVDENYGPLNKEQHELLSDIDASTIRLITMVNEMLDITKIEKGDLELTLETFDAGEIIHSVIADLGDYAERHVFTIVYHTPDALPLVYADKVRVRQIFQNLIDNAIKYSNHPGRLDIMCRQLGTHVEILFKDNGIGIPKIEQSKLFERFYRASNTAKTTSSGSGLGLYIVRSIIKQLGGDISFESEENSGTTFRTTFLINK